MRLRLSSTRWADRRECRAVLADHTLSPAARCPEPCTQSGDARSDPNGGSGECTSSTARCQALEVEFQAGIAKLLALVSRGGPASPTRIGASKQEVGRLNGALVDAIDARSTLGGHLIVNDVLCSAVHRVFSFGAFVFVSDGQMPIVVNGNCCQGGAITESMSGRPVAHCGFGDLPEGRSLRPGEAIVELRRNYVQEITAPSQPLQRSLQRRPFQARGAGDNGCDTDAGTCTGRACSQKAYRRSRPDSCLEEGFLLKRVAPSLCLSDSDSPMASSRRSDLRAPIPRANRRASRQPVWAVVVPRLDTSIKTGCHGAFLPRSRRRHSVIRGSARLITLILEAVSPPTALVAIL